MSTQFESSPAGKPLQQDVVPLTGTARLPTPSDNVAIATRHLDAGLRIAHEGSEIRLEHSVMEGHRFVLHAIPKGDELTSWGLPFGRSTRDLSPGEYVCNEKILSVLKERNVTFEFPASANFVDHMRRYEVDSNNFAAGTQVPRFDTPGTFKGYNRGPNRGVGTRNFLAILGTTSRSAGFARALAARFESASDRFPNVDGVVALTHTEGGGSRTPNNLDKVLRTLAGFVVHPNLAAVMAVDYGEEVFTNDDLEQFMVENGYHLDPQQQHFFRIDTDTEQALDIAAARVEVWLEQANRVERVDCPLSELKVALQCGGSDAFSGISGNALAGRVARTLIQHGGSANLAETDELIGAEPYVLSNVKNIETARDFLNRIDVFKSRVERHGASAEGNPSGGNNYRGLYNIALKSIGAARKKDPEVRLDAVLDYAQRMDEPGYYFMDSPGNDLESIAGQVASGSNLIFFITGNGSITNFPFVPTLKFVTTSGRFAMLANEMDVNAGRYNDGESMEELAGETFELTRSVASGQRSKGELAGHAQVQLWRDWQQTEDGQVELIRARDLPDGKPLEARAAEPMALSYRAYANSDRPASDQIGLVMPTSLCSGQVAQLIADYMNTRRDQTPSVTRFVALPHTEGCGSANAEDIYLQTLLGHLTHPFTRYGVLLEHGCEKTHNDAIRHYLVERGVNLDHFGWASVQMDGGISNVREKVSGWFESVAQNDNPLQRLDSSASGLRIGIMSDAPLQPHSALALAELATRLVAAGATIVLPGNDPSLTGQDFRDRLFAQPDRIADTISYGEPASTAGLHLMRTPTDDLAEVLTGLAGTGVELVVAHVAKAPIHSHPMVPVLQVSGAEGVQKFARDLDLMLNEQAPAATLAYELCERIREVLEGDYQPRLHKRQSMQFQLTRGFLGVSL